MVGPIVGRDAELGAVDEILAPSREGLGFLVLEGEAGIGKTTVCAAAPLRTAALPQIRPRSGLGFGFWWIYFDVVGDRLPRGDGRSLVAWTLSHLPVTFAIVAAGAAMVSLIAHAHDPVTPAPTAWLLSGAVALGLVAEVVTTRALADNERLAVVYRPLRLALLAGAVAAVVIGWMQPAPWLLGLLLGGVMSVLWFYTVATFLRADAWMEEEGRG